MVHKREDILCKNEGMLFSMVTGEVFETHSAPFKARGMKPSQAFDFSSVSNKKQAEKMFYKDKYNPDIRTHWTNWAVEVLTSVDPIAAKRFSALSKLIISRNFIFDTNKNIAETIDCNPKHLNANLRKMQSHGLIKIRKDHAGGQSYKLIQVNPTLVFKTYIAPEREPYDNFGHNKVLNNLHADYVKMWLQDSVEKSSYMY